MTVVKATRILAAATALAAVPLLSAMPQTQPPAPAATNSPPAVAKPDVGVPPAQRQTTLPVSPDDGKPAATAAMKPLVGLAVVSSDGRSLGTVHSEMAEPGGKATTIYLKTGGFLGFGSHLVAIPDSKFTLNGNTVQVNMTADEVSKLPEAKEQS